MATFKVKSKTNVNVNKKPRVYFTCHPDDFDTYFKPICSDIFRTHDCAVYYTEDMTADIPADVRETDLERNHLFVIPVTRKLLTSPSRTMSLDYPYARQKGIRVLPIVMEAGLDTLYALPQNFGELQYLTPHGGDGTEIPYAEKLAKYLTKVLISDEKANRIRDAFGAHIFLSYRKADRVYANRLMRKIHSYPECRDIAVWFDEFLAPGEDFTANIDKELLDCDLFALLVTPRLLQNVITEDGEERKNFVLDVELPSAKQNGLDILAVEMEKTDRNALAQEGIADCVRFDEDAFQASLLAAAEHMNITPNNSPEHLFLIGSAYLEGIDVERDIQRGMAMIRSASEAGYLEAATELLMYAVDMSDMAAENFDQQRTIYISALKGFESNLDKLSVQDESLFNYMITLYKTAGLSRMQGDMVQFAHLLTRALQLAKQLEPFVFGENLKSIAHIYNDGAVSFLLNLDGTHTQDEVLRLLQKSVNLFRALASDIPSCRTYAESVEQTIATVKQEFTDEVMQKMYRERTEPPQQMREEHLVLQQLVFYLSKGDLLEKASDFEGACFFYKAALDKYEAADYLTSDAEGILLKADLYDRLAVCCEQLENYDEAREYYSNALSLALEAAWDSHSASAYDSAICYLEKLAGFCQKLELADDAATYLALREMMLAQKWEHTQQGAPSDIGSPPPEPTLSDEATAALNQLYDEFFGDDPETDNNTEGGD